MPDLRPSGLPAVPLGQVAAGLRLPARPEWDDCLVTGVTLDSRAVGTGDLFAALPGEKLHGGRFAALAAASGAVAILTDAPDPEDLDPEAEAGLLAAGLPLLRVADPRAVLGGLAARVYAEPSRGMSLLGVTGTNGKTTTSYLLEAGLAAAGHTTALLGTIETRIAGERLPSARTTPEAPELQALLAVARERGVDAAAMEVSSHALAQHRVDGTWFEAALFTNLSQDHLDFHGGMDRYFAAKSMLFTPERTRTAVICVDDDWGELLVERVRLPLVTVSTRGVPWADWRIADVRADARGSIARALGPAGEDLELRVALAGAYNLANALTALAGLVATGIDPQVAAAGIGALPGVPGRMQRVEAGQQFTALVDYAHTPASVTSLLTTLRPLTRGRLVVVLGCGGDRDRGKRPLMARAAVDGSDLAVLTSDNPRSEDPSAILAEMTAGLRGSAAGAFRVEADRARAIALAAAGLGPGDTLVVAGKGHETGQQLADRLVAFDDRTVLRAAILGEPAGAACG